MTETEWNKKYPIGTKVRYRPVMGRDDHLDTRTRSFAWRMGCGEPVVSLVDVAGGVSLFHLEVITD
jgi:hypothetical protein